MGKTRGVHETTPELRNRMVGMYEAGLGLREIAAAVNCSQRTVKRWLNRFDREGNVETRDRCGRKRATTTEQDDAIVHLATSTTITAAKAVLPALGLKCSVDTIRERLHKAGIHNWSPSRKQIQRIPLGDADGAALQQAVWRPTGTQLGKKKHSKTPERVKSPSKVKKKKVSKKPKDLDPVNNASIDEPNSIANNETSGSQENQQKISQVMSFNTPQPIIHCSELPPLDPTPPDMNAPFPNIANQPDMYHQDLTPWSVDLNPQNQAQYLPNQSNIPPTSSHLQELYPQNNHLQQHQPVVPMDPSLTLTQTNLNPTTLSQNNPTVSPSESSNSSFETTSCQADDFSRKKSKESQPEMSSKLDSHENSKDSSEDFPENLEGSESTKKKKGGKAKGTLETSVELRNRMIGMSQAGLSTLSIALAINRSERTVKRWLERWKKEGNVKTKERKGRRRITTKEQDDAIIAMATQNPLTAAKLVAPALGLQCSVDTIRERLHKAGIHSWKLGKKQGEGNAVHTVHLWQPSGNRPNRPRILKKTSGKKSGKKAEGSNQKASDGKRKTSKKTQEKIVENQDNIQPPTSVEMQPPATIDQPMQFHDNSAINYNSNSNVLQPVGILTPLNPTSGQQQVQLVAPVMRPDCRMATGQVSQGYSSCMVNGGGHIEQSDHLNYEPYIWNF